MVGILIELGMALPAMVFLEGSAMVTPRSRFWIDDFGCLWMGPCRKGPEGFRFVRFEGMNADGSAAWDWGFPDVNMEETGVGRAAKIIDKHRQEAAKQ